VKHDEIRNYFQNKLFININEKSEKFNFRIVNILTSKMLPKSILIHGNSYRQLDNPNYTIGGTVSKYLYYVLCSYQGVYIKLFAQGSLNEYSIKSSGQSFENLESVIQYVDSLANVVSVVNPSNIKCNRQNCQGCQACSALSIYRNIITVKSKLSKLIKPDIEKQFNKIQFKSVLASIKEPVMLKKVVMVENRMMKIPLALLPPVEVISADFDGDEMSIHVPQTVQASIELNEFKKKDSLNIIMNDKKSRLSDVFKYNLHYLKICGVKNYIAFFSIDLTDEDIKFLNTLADYGDNLDLDYVCEQLAK
jgi:hypothetical protein